MRVIARSSDGSGDRGATIVELLVTVAIIAVLASILLPAVQNARESSRLIQCSDNARNITTALLIYHSSHKSFPDGGWGHQWVGVPDRGTGRRQPGGWAYSTLPYLEEQALHDLGIGLDGAEASEAYSQRLQTPIPIFTCPSRRSCTALIIVDQYAYVRTPRPHGNVTVVARGDYAINAGASHAINLGGPLNLQQGDDPSYWKNAPNTTSFSGISHLRIGASIRSITDGTSKTYLIGEKHVPEDSYLSGTSPGDNESLYSGYCTDLHRFSGNIANLKIGQSPHAVPLHDYATASGSVADYYRFGSAHAAGVNLSLCDGSVQLVSYDVAPDVHFRAGHRRDDGNPLDSLD